MWVGNVFVVSLCVFTCLSLCLRVCVSVCMCLYVCLSFCLGYKYLVWWYILTIPRSHFSINVTGSRSRLHIGKCLFFLYICLSQYYSSKQLLRSRSETRSRSSQSHDYSKVKLQVLTFYQQAGGGLLTEMNSCVMF